MFQMSGLHIPLCTLRKVSCRWCFFWIPSLFVFLSWLRSLPKFMSSWRELKFWIALLGFLWTSFPVGGMVCRVSSLDQFSRLLFLYFPSMEFSKLCSVGNHFAWTPQVKRQVYLQAVRIALALRVRIALAFSFQACNWDDVKCIYLFEATAFLYTVVEYPVEVLIISMSNITSLLSFFV